MLEWDAGRKAHRTFAASSEIETGLSQINDPKQGARLVRAFLRITDPTVRLAIVKMIENVGSAPADRIEDQPLSINRSRTNSGGRSGAEAAQGPAGRHRHYPADTKRAHHKGQDL